MEPLTNKEFDIEDQKRRRLGQAGFTLIESMIAIMIITIGLIGTAAAISTALKFSRISRNVTDAKALALSQIEQIHSLRDSRSLNFGQIENVGFVNNAGANINFDGFDTGFKSIPEGIGADGIAGTADDLLQPSGADGVSGTPDDPTFPVKYGFTRETVITTPAGLPNLKQIVVTVKYPGADGNTYQVSCTSYLNNDLKQL